MSEPTKPGGFDPRRLADLASRLGARPAPAQAESSAAVTQPVPQAPAAQPPVPQSPAPRPSMPGAAVDARSGDAGPPVGAGETAGPAGQPHLEAILAELERAEGLPPDQQIPVYESVHRTLQETLRSIEQS